MSESTKSQISGLKLAANSYSKLKDYTKAEKSIRKALDLNPDSKKLEHELAKIFLKSKNYDKALQIINNNSEIFEKIVKVLMEKQVISGEEVKNINDSEK